MPSAPVIRHGIGENRPPEIFCKIDAEKMRHAPGGINSAGEIAVKLNTVKKYGQRDDAPAVTVIIIEDRIDQDSRPVCDDQLLKVSPQHQLNSAAQVFKIEIPLSRQLTAQVAEPADRPLYHLRKERYEKRIMPDIVLHRIFAAVAVDDITAGLKYIIGNSQRHEDIDLGHRSARDLTENFQRSVQIFHHIEHTEIEDQRGGGHTFLPPLPQILVQLPFLRIETF